MSNLGEMLKRVAKGDVDPAHWKGSPTSKELRQNASARDRRDKQINFEENNKLLADAGGSTDPKTQQIGKLKPWQLGTRQMVRMIMTGPIGAVVTAAKTVKLVKKRKDEEHAIEDQLKSELSQASRSRLTPTGTVSLTRTKGILGKRRQPG